MKVQDGSGFRYLEGPIGKKLMSTDDDVMVVLEACANNDIDKVLLYASNMSDNFFDLKSREAGNILQKLRNYAIKLALVLDDESLLTGRFGEMVGEEKKGSDFSVFTDTKKAIDWLR